MRSLLLAIVVALLACSRYPLDFAVDPTFSRDDVAAFHTAAERWNAVTLPAARISFDGENWWIANRAPVHGFNGLTHSFYHVIEVNSARADREPTLALIMHELGHAIGLPHSCVNPRAQGDVVADAPGCVPGVPRGVMDPVGSLDQIAAIDLELCKREGACK